MSVALSSAEVASEVHAQTVAMMSAVRWIEAVVTVMTAWAWPAVVLVGVVLLRKQLAGLVNRLTRAEGPGGIAFAFKAEVNATSQLAEVAVPNAPTTLPTSGDGRYPHLSQQPTLEDLVQEAEQHPVGAVVRAWNVVEAVADRFIHKKGFPVSQLVSGMASYDLVADDLASLARRLQGLRNQVVHGKAIPDRASARDFVEAAWRLAAALEKVPPSSRGPDGQ